MRKTELQNSNGQFDPNIYHDGHGNIITGPKPESLPAESTDRSFISPRTGCLIIGFTVLMCSLYACVSQDYLELNK